MVYKLNKIRNILDKARKGFPQGFRPAVRPRVHYASKWRIENHGRKCFSRRIKW